jgi:hypothetical protein
MCSVLYPSLVTTYHEHLWQTFLILLIIHQRADPTSPWPI